MPPVPPQQFSLGLERPLEGRENPLVISDCNRQAVEALTDWPNLIGGAMALSGPKGSGKTRLATEWAERTGAHILSGPEADAADLSELEGHPILLDRADLASEEALFHLINLAQAPGGALLLVARTSPKHWPSTLPDLRSRLDAMSILTIEAPDDPVLEAILEARFAERGIKPAADVIPYLLFRIERSADAAAAVVDQLDAAGGAVNRASARQVLNVDGDLFR